MSIEEPHPAVPKPRLRWYQYRLKTLLLAVTLASVGMSWFTTSRQWAEERRRAQYLNNLAEWEVTCWPWLDGKGRTEAVEHARRACELSSWRNAGHLATFSAAQALNGDFDAACKWQAKGIELENDTTRKRAYSARLALYAARKTYRETKHDWFIGPRFRWVGDPDARQKDRQATP